MYTNSDMTLYHYDKNQNIYQRNYIYGVFWDSEKRSNMLKTGNVNIDSLLIMVPATHVTTLEITTGKDLAVKGICRLDISNGSQAAQTNSIKRLMAENQVYTITSCDAKLYGSPSLQHYELSGK